MDNALLKNDIAVVTGAGKGIGRALALGLARAGARVAACDIDEPALAETVGIARAGGLTMRGAGVDITDRSACEKFARETEAAFGPVSVLVNNAAVLRSADVGDASFFENWRMTFAVNLDGTMNMIATLLDQLERTRGRIVNVGSTAAFLAAEGGSAYAASKGAVTQLTRALAVELGHKGIRVNAIAPGVTTTPLAASAIDRNREQYLQRIPLGRIASPEDMCGPVIFLASALSAHVTGVVLPIDGGYLATGITRGNRALASQT